MAEKKKKERQRLKAKYTLPNHEVSVQNQLNVLRVLVTASMEGEHSTSAEDVGTKGLALGINPSVVQKCFAFLSELGLIQGTRTAMTPASQVVDWAKQQGSDPDGAKAILAPSFLNAWFGQALADAFKLSEKVALNDLIKILGQTAEAQPADLARPKLRLLMGFLEHFDYVEKGEGDTYTLAEARPVKERAAKPQQPPPPPPPSAAVGAQVSITLNVQLDPTVTEQQAINLAKAIRRILDTLSEEGDGGRSD